MIPEGTKITKGDKLVRTFGYSASFQMVEVERVTPGGQIILTNGQKFYKDGCGTVGDKFSQYTLHLQTEEIMAQMRLNNAKAIVRQINIQDLDDESIIQIAKIIQAAKKKKESDNS